IRAGAHVTQVGSEDIAHVQCQRAPSADNKPHVDILRRLSLINPYRASDAYNLIGETVEKKPSSAAPYVCPGFRTLFQFDKSCNLCRMVGQTD
ncbi:hypothetical protein CSKR_203314, partial [Clonorchis sinensis]